MPTSLPDMPLETLLKILGNLHFKELLPIRQVSKTLLTIVDEQLIDSKITYIQFSVTSYSFLARIDYRDVIYYQHKRERDAFYRDGSDVPKDKESMTTVAVNAMTGILRFKTSPLKGLRLEYGFDQPDTNTLNIKKIRGGLERYLRNRPNKLKTKNLIIDSMAVRSLIGILRYIEPTVLEEFRAFTNPRSSVYLLADGWGTEQEVLQWLGGRRTGQIRLKRLVLKNYIKPSMLLKYGNLEKFKVCVTQVHPSTLQMIRKMFISPNSIMRKFTFFLRDVPYCDTFRKDLVQAFGEPSEENDNRILWKFETSDPTMMLHVEKKSEKIRFRRVQVDN